VMVGDGCRAGGVHLLVGMVALSLRVLGWSTLRDVYSSERSQLSSAINLAVPKPMIKLMEMPTLEDTTMAEPEDKAS